MVYLELQFLFLNFHNQVDRLNLRKRIILYGCALILSYRTQIIVNEPLMRWFMLSFWYETIKTFKTEAKLYQ